MKKIFIYILILTGIILIISEVNSFYTSKRIAEKRICNMNKNRIYNGVEFYLLDYKKNYRDITLKKLFSKKYIKKMYACPCGGKYIIKVSDSKKDPDVHIINIKCSYHDGNKYMK